MEPKTPTAEDSYEGEVGPQRRRMPSDRSGVTHKVEILDETSGRVQEGYINVNWHEGDILEVFLQGFGKEGSTLEGWVQLSAILLSTALQYGAELPMLVRKIAHMKFPPYGKTDNPEIPYCRSVPDYIVRFLAIKSGNIALQVDLKQIDQNLERQGL